MISSLSIVVWKPWTRRKTTRFTFFATEECGLTKRKFLWHNRDSSS